MSKLHHNGCFLQERAHSDHVICLSVCVCMCGTLEVYKLFIREQERKMLDTTWEFNEA